MKQKITLESLKLLRDKIFIDNEDIKAYVVLESLKTGKDFTYKIVNTDVRDTKKVFIQLENAYNKFATFYYGNTYYNDFIKSQYYEDNFSNNEIKANGAWLLEKLKQNKLDTILKVCNLYHCGKCLKCGRKLTDLESIEIGMGSKCRTT